MAEIMYILTILYFVYVINHVVINDKQITKEGSDSRSPNSTNKAQTVESSSIIEKIELNVNELRNPESGEVAKVFSNYQMNKRWIKQALVDEGFLEQIYKTKELDDAAKLRINEALEQLKKMEKYQ